MSAVNLRRLFITGIILTLGGVAAIIYFASGMLSAEVLKTVHARTDAELSAQDVTRLQQLEDILNNNQDSVKKAEQIVSESKQYQYQDQIVNDLNTYAARANVGIVGYNFAAPDDEKKPTSTKDKNPQKKIEGVKTLTVTVSLEQSVPFDNYLRFLRAIEQNLTKMQVTGVNLSPDPEIIGNISNPTVGLTVYVR